MAYITTGTTLRLNSDLRVEAKEWHQEWLKDEDKEHGVHYDWDHATAELRLEG